METLFRRAALACWTSILAVVLVVGLFANPPQHVLARMHLVDSGADLALERAAAIQYSAPAAEAPPPEVPTGPPPPGRLVISSIGVNARVVPVGLAKDGSMGVTSTSYDVGWYSPGVKPGEPGDAVIDGHLDWYDTSQAVFYNLKLVHVGDVIEVQRLDGVTKHFRVTSVKTVPYNATVPGLFAADGPPRLSLITCGGPWNQKLGEYLQRVIVDASLTA